VPPHVKYDIKDIFPDVKAATSAFVHSVFDTMQILEQFRLCVSPTSHSGKKSHRPQEVQTGDQVNMELAQELRDIASDLTLDTQNGGRLLGRFGAALNMTLALFNIWFTSWRSGEPAAHDEPDNPFDSDSEDGTLTDGYYHGNAKTLEDAHSSYHKSRRRRTRTQAKSSPTRNTNRPTLLKDGPVATLGSMFKKKRV